MATRRASSPLVGARPSEGIDLVARPLDAFSFHHADCKKRLMRWCTVAITTGAFLVGLFVWLATMPSWYLLAVVFLPTFAMDVANVYWYRYLRSNVARFQGRTAVRFGVIAAGSFLYKALLLTYCLLAPSDPKLLPMDLVVLPFALAFVIQLLMGNQGSNAVEATAEGCSTLSTLTAELGRFLIFVLVLSVTIKVTVPGEGPYSWTSALWPIYGVIGVVLLALVVILPATLVSIVGLVVARCRGAVISEDWASLMFAWLAVSLAGFGGASLVAVSELSTNVLVAPSVCPSILSFRDHLQHSKCIWSLANCTLPLAGFMLVFAAVTRMILVPLTDALHYAWFADEMWEGGSGSAVPAEPARAVQVCPTVMYRVTPTLYHRTPKFLLAARARADGATLSTADFAPRYEEEPALYKSMDRPASILEQASGSQFSQIVDGEQCFVCFDARPNAVLLECGHSGLCCRCALNLKLRGTRRTAVCPICRSPIDHIVRVVPDKAPPGWLRRKVAGFRDSVLRSAGRSGVSELEKDDTRTVGMSVSSQAPGVTLTVMQSQEPDSILASANPPSNAFHSGRSMDPMRSRLTSSVQPRRSFRRAALRHAVVVEPVHWTRPTAIAEGREVPRPSIEV